MGERSEMNENEFEHDGVKYRAVDAQVVFISKDYNKAVCIGCAFVAEGFSEACHNAPCVPFVRQDKRQVIFVKVTP
jgi:coproporphyrinogen III oxidase